MLSNYAYIYLALAFFINLGVYIFINFASHNLLIIKINRMNFVQLYHLTFFLITFLFTCVRTLYFHINEGDKRCFIEEIPDETMVIYFLLDNRLRKENFSIFF